MLKRLFKKQCPDDETVACYIDGLLPEKEKIVVDKHLKACAGCREAFAIHREVADRQKVEELGPVPEYLVESARNLWAERHGVKFLDIAVTLVEDFIQGLKTTGDIIAGAGQDLQYAGAMRGASEEKVSSVVVRKVIEDVSVEVEVSRAVGAISNVVLRVADNARKTPRTDLRATLILDDTELESYVTEGGMRTFENVRPGKYILQISDMKKILGVISLEIKQA
ncbi:MAG: zf-HC2 domain-containing protein [Candidatus Omnitrophica bacterium]|nr:zf-HC2 domain-containing protein [Candidatus Omnitrophota bacterium]